MNHEHAPQTPAIFGKDLTLESLKKAAETINTIEWGGRVAEINSARAAAAKIMDQVTEMGVDIPDHVLNQDMLNQMAEQVLAEMVHPLRIIPLRLDGDRWIPLAMAACTDMSGPDLLNRVHSVTELMTVGTGADAVAMVAEGAFSMAADLSELEGESLSDRRRAGDPRVADCQVTTVMTDTAMVTMMVPFHTGMQVGQCYLGDPIYIESNLSEYGPDDFEEACTVAGTLNGPPLGFHSTRLCLVEYKAKHAAGEPGHQNFEQGPGDHADAMLYLTRSDNVKPDASLTVTVAHAVHSAFGEWDTEVPEDPREWADHLLRSAAEILTLEAAAVDLEGHPEPRRRADR